MTEFGIYSFPMKPWAAGLDIAGVTLFTVSLDFPMSIGC